MNGAQTRQTEVELWTRRHLHEEIESIGILTKNELEVVVVMTDHIKASTQLLTNFWTPLRELKDELKSIGTMCKDEGDGVVAFCGWHKAMRD